MGQSCKSTRLLFALLVVCPHNLWAQTEEFLGTSHESVQFKLAKLVNANPETFRFTLRQDPKLDVGAIVALKTGIDSPRILAPPDISVSVHYQAMPQAYLSETLELDAASPLARELFSSPLDATLDSSITLKINSLRERRASFGNTFSIPDIVTALPPDKQPDADELVQLVSRICEANITIELRSKGLLTVPPVLSLKGFRTERVFLPGPETLDTYSSNTPLVIAYETSTSLTPVVEHFSRSVDEYVPGALSRFMSRMLSTYEARVQSAAPAKQMQTAWERTSNAQQSMAIDQSFGREVELFYATDRAPPTGEVQFIWTMVEVLVAPAREYPTLTVSLYAVLLGCWMWSIVSGCGGFRKCYCWSLMGFLLLPAILLGLGSFARGSRVTNSSLLYGNSIGELSFGTCLVHIPESYRSGPGNPPALPKPLLSWKKGKPPVLVESPLPFREAVWSEKLKARLNELPKKTVLLFVHGYNNTFDEAAASAALLTLNLDFRGQTIFFSWPSQGITCGYAIDATLAENAQPHLRQLIEKTATDTDADEIYVVAHSMGNRVALGALSAICKQSGNSPVKQKLRECVLAAADVDALKFRHAFADDLLSISRRVTLYGSQNDAALKASRQFNGFPRVGDGGSNLMIYPKIESIDASPLDTSQNSHSYVIMNRSVLADLANVLASVPIDNRQLAKKMRDQLPFWEFVP